MVHETVHIVDLFTAHSVNLFEFEIIKISSHKLDIYIDLS